MLPILRPQLRELPVSFSSMPVHSMIENSGGRMNGTAAMACDGPDKNAPCRRFRISTAKYGFNILAGLDVAG
jgi:hypothetical protein